MPRQDLPSGRAAVTADCSLPPPCHPLPPPCHPLPPSCHPLPPPCNSLQTGGTQPPQPASSGILAYARPDPAPSGIGITASILPDFNCAPFLSTIPPPPPPP
jgi:hypothetical protein